jgi:cyanophycin synthetase
MKQTITNTNHLILLEAAKNLGLKTQILQASPPLIKFSSQAKTHLIGEKSFGLNRSSRAKIISRNKALTLKTLKAASLPVPQQIIINRPKEYLKKYSQIAFPQVIKPLSGEKGRLVFLNIKNKTQGKKALKQIFLASPTAVVESHHQGKDYRFLVLNQRLIGLSQRLPPTITADGQSSIQQLIQQENQRRQQLTQKLGKRLLNRMRNWKQISLYLQLQGLSLKTILPQGKKITLYPLPNFSAGGSTKTINPKTIHPSIIQLAEKASQAIGLDIVGIDMLIKNIHRPASANNLVIIEANSDPGIRLHDWPNQGRSQHVAETILKSIFTR